MSVSNEKIETTVIPATKAEPTKEPKTEPILEPKTETPQIEGDKNDDFTSQKDVKEVKNRRVDQVRGAGGRGGARGGAGRVRTGRTTKTDSFMKKHS